MSLIKRPSELEVNAALSALIYGVPGIGKSTLACSAPSPVMFDFDNGVNRMDAAHQVDTVQVKSWETCLEAVAEVEQAPQYKTIVIDTVGKMLLYMEDYIKRVTSRSNPSYLMRDGSLSLKGYGERKKMFVDFNNRLKMAGRNIVYVAHEVEQKRKIGKDEVTVKRPEVGGSSINDLLKELDLVGYMQAYDSRRMITFDPQETFYAKNSCGIFGVVEIPVLIDATGRVTGENNYFTHVVDSFHQRLANNKDNAVKFDALKKEIIDKAESIENAEDANNYVKWVVSVDHVFNSKVIAQQALTAKVSALGLKYNKITKVYSDESAA